MLEVCTHVNSFAHTHFGQKVLELRPTTTTKNNAEPRLAGEQTSMYLFT